jgi:protein-tyrosine phosphatase
MVIRTVTSCIRLVNRVGKGVIVMRLKDDDVIRAVAMVENLDDEESEDQQVCDIETPDEGNQPPSDQNTE